VTLAQNVSGFRGRNQACEAHWSPRVARRASEALEPLYNPA
jgi:hypothetical protein